MRRLEVYRAVLVIIVVSVLLRPVGAALAHNPDTSYARVTLSSSSVHLEFTYDIATLARMAPMDANGDDRITRAEISAVAAAIQDYLRTTIFLELDSEDAELGRALPPTWPEDAGESIASADWRQQLITFGFDHAVAEIPEEVALVFDIFEELGERHTVLGVFVHGGEEHPVIFTRLEPDYLYDLTYRPDSTESTESAAGLMGEFLVLGIKHISLGYDHILFLLGLIIAGRFRDLVKIVTAFTVAHTITLTLATLELVSLPSRLIETAIAATIVYVAAENLWKKEPKRRWVLTFAFGLVHGFGFANVLGELRLPRAGLMRSLFAFNLGVEVGQIAIVAAAWPLIVWANRRGAAARARFVFSIAILAAGVAWLVERAFGVKLLPF